MKHKGLLWNMFYITGAIFSQVRSQENSPGNSTDTRTNFDADFPDYPDRDYPSLDYYNDYPREGRSLGSSDGNGAQGRGHFDDAMMRQLRTTIPGVPGQDYGLHQSVPHTSFDCAEHGSPGFYGDVEAQCQVFHVCQENDRVDSFLCPLGTVFNQISFVCDWWFNFRCEDTPSHYHLNGRLHSRSSASLVEDAVKSMEEARGQEVGEMRRVGRGFVRVRKSRGGGKEVGSEEVGGNETRSNGFRGKEAGGSAARGNETGNEVKSNEIRGKEVSGKEVRGTGDSGNEVRSNEIRGKEVGGNEVRSNEIRGKDPSGSEARGNEGFGDIVGENEDGGDGGTGDVGGNMLPKVMDLFMRKVRRRKIGRFRIVNRPRSRAHADGVVEYGIAKELNSSTESSVVWIPVEGTSLNTNAEDITSATPIALPIATNSPTELSVPGDIATAVNNNLVADNPMRNFKFGDRIRKVPRLFPFNRLKRVENMTGDEEKSTITAHRSSGIANLAVEAGNKTDDSDNKIRDWESGRTRAEGYSSEKNINAFDDSSANVPPLNSDAWLNSSSPEQKLSHSTPAADEAVENVSLPFRRRNNFVIGNDTHITVSVSIHSDKGRSRLHWKRIPGVEDLAKIRLKDALQQAIPQTNAVSYKKRVLPEKPHSRVMWIPVKRNRTEAGRLVLPVSLVEMELESPEANSTTTMATTSPADATTVETRSPATSGDKPFRGGLVVRAPDYEETLGAGFSRFRRVDNANAVLMVKPMYSRGDFLRSMDLPRGTRKECRTACIKLLRILGRGRTLDGRTSTTFLDDPDSLTFLDDDNDLEPGRSERSPFERRAVLGASSSEHSVKYDPGPKCKGQGGAGRLKGPVSGWSVIVDSGSVTKEKTVKRRSCPNAGKPVRNDSKGSNVGFDCRGDRNNKGNAVDPGWKAKGNNVGSGRKVSKGVNSKGSNVRFDSRDSSRSKGGDSQAGSMDQRYWLNLVKNWLENSPSHGDRTPESKGDDDRGWATSYHTPQWDDSSGKSVERSRRRADRAADGQLVPDGSSDLQTEKSDWSEATERAGQVTRPKSPVRYAFRDENQPRLPSGGDRRNRGPAGYRLPKSFDDLVLDGDDGSSSRERAPFRNAGAHRLREDTAPGEGARSELRTQDWPRNFNGDRDEEGSNQQRGNHKGWDDTKGASRGRPQHGNEKGFLSGSSTGGGKRKPDSWSSDSRQTRSDEADWNSDIRPNSKGDGRKRSRPSQDGRISSKGQGGRTSPGSKSGKSWNSQKPDHGDGSLMRPLPPRNDGWASMKPVTTNPSKGTSFDDWSSDPGRSDADDSGSRAQGDAGRDWQDEGTIGDGDWSNEKPKSGTWPADGGQIDRDAFASKGTGGNPSTNKGSPFNPARDDDRPTFRKGQKNGWPQTDRDGSSPEDFSSNRQNKKGDGSYSKGTPAVPPSRKSKASGARGNSGNGKFNGKGDSRQKGLATTVRPNKSSSSRGSEKPKGPSKLIPRSDESSSSWRSSKGTESRSKEGRDFDKGKGSGASSSHRSMKAKGSNRNGRRSSSKGQSWSSGMQPKQSSKGQKGKASRMEGSSRGLSKGGRMNNEKSKTPMKGGLTISDGKYGLDQTDSSVKGDSETTTIVWSARISDDGKLGNGWVPITGRPDLKKSNDSGTKDWKATTDDNKSSDGDRSSSNDRKGDESWPSPVGDSDDEDWPLDSGAGDGGKTSSDADAQDEDWSSSNEDAGPENWPSSNVGFDDEDWPPSDSGKDEEDWSSSDASKDQEDWPSSGTNKGNEDWPSSGSTTRKENWPSSGNTKDEDWPSSSSSKDEEDWPSYDRSKDEEDWNSSSNSKADEVWPSSGTIRDDENWPASDKGKDSGWLSSNRRKSMKDYPSPEAYIIQKDGPENWPSGSMGRSRDGFRAKIQNPFLVDSQSDNQSNSRTDSDHSSIDAKFSSSKEDGTNKSSSKVIDLSDSNADSGEFSIDSLFNSSYAEAEVRSTISVATASNIESQTSPQDQESHDLRTMADKLDSGTNNFLPMPILNQRQKRSYANTTGEEGKRKSLKIIRNGKVVTKIFRADPKDKVLFAGANILVSRNVMTNSSLERGAKQPNNQTKGKFPSFRVNRTYKASVDVPPEELSPATNDWSSPIFSSNMSASGWIPVVSIRPASRPNSPPRTYEDVLPEFEHPKNSSDAGRTSLPFLQNGAKGPSREVGDARGTELRVDSDRTSGATRFRSGKTIRVGNGTLMILSFSDVARNHPSTSNNLDSLANVSRISGNEAWLSEDEDSRHDAEASHPPNAAPRFNQTEVKVDDQILRILPFSDVMKAFTPTLENHDSANVIKVSENETRTAHGGGSRWRMDLPDPQNTVPALNETEMNVRNETFRVLSFADVVKTLPPSKDVYKHERDKILWSAPLQALPKTYSLKPVERSGDNKANLSNTWVFPGGNGTKQAWVLSTNPDENSGVISTIGSALVLNGLSGSKSQPSNRRTEKGSKQASTGPDDGLRDEVHRESKHLGDKSSWMPVVTTVGRVVPFNRTHIKQKINHDVNNH